MDRCKARLVAKGFTRKEGMDFKETFNPIVKFDSIKKLFSITTAEDMNTVNLTFVPLFSMVK